MAFDAVPFLNRIRKNQAHLAKWAQRNGVEAYRIYDRDMPEYPFAVDRYGDALVLHYFDRRPQPHLFSPEADEKRAREEIRGAESALCSHFELHPALLFVKRRRLRQEGDQYDRVSESKVTRTVEEHGLRFLVNLSDYLDTGLFLDYRKVRMLVRAMSSGKRVLNLFCYTGSVSVYAGAGGAAQVMSVDMSNTYLDWAKENFLLNGLDVERNIFLRADCVPFLKTGSYGTFDLIVIDPPSFSKSKKMLGVFDVQEDHLELIRAAMRHLNPGGTILFSTNLRSFKLDTEGLGAGVSVRDLTAQTIPEDFRNDRIHKVFLLEPQLLP
jgi:23S rRNA (cytosine1962-C5)-methyltransferase